MYEIYDYEKGLYLDREMERKQKEEAEYKVRLENYKRTVHQYEMIKEPWKGSSLFNNGEPEHLEPVVIKELEAGKRVDDIFIDENKPKIFPERSFPL